MTLRSFRSVAGALVLAMSLSAIAAADRFIDPKSTLSATFTVKKVPVEAPFHKFSGHIDYDLANPAALAAFAQSNRTVALQLVDAVDRRDVQKLSDLGGSLDEVCEACHKTFWYPDQK
jgi:hypothetical protein